MRQLRVGCIGTGFIASRHLQALSGFPDVAVVAVADPVLARAETASTRYGARCYRDGVDLLENEELDAVWLCVPPFAHGPVEALAVDRGVPFFVEKPLAVDLATARGIAERVRESGLLTAVGYHWRHLSGVDELRERLHTLTARLVIGHWLDETPGAPWWSRRDQSGGQMLEQVTHLFDLVRVLVGEVDTVHAVELAPPGREPLDGHVPAASVVTLRFANGAIGTISASRVLPARHRVGLQVICDGIIVEVCERSLSDHEVRVVTDAGEAVQQSDEDPIETEDREFLDAVLGRVDAVRVPYEEALRTHALSWAVDQSARSGVAVRPALEALRV